MTAPGLVLDTATAVVGGPGARAHIISSTALMGVADGALRPRVARSTLAPPALVIGIVDPRRASRRPGLAGPA